METMESTNKKREGTESRKGAAGLLGVMGGVELTPEMIKNGSYIEKLEPISAVMWVDEIKIGNSLNIIYLLCYNHLEKL